MDIRRENLKKLLERFRSQRAFQDHAGVSQAQVSSILTGRRVMGADVARRIEQALSLPPYWMESEHAEAPTKFAQGNVGEYSKTVHVPRTEDGYDEAIDAELRSFIFDDMVLFGHSRGWNVIYKYAEHTPYGMLKPDLTMQKDDDILCVELKHAADSRNVQNQVNTILAQIMRYRVAGIKPVYAVLISADNEGQALTRLNMALTQAKSDDLIADFLMTSESYDFKKMIS